MLYVIFSYAINTIILIVAIFYLISIRTILALQSLHKAIIIYYSTIHRSKKIET
jgi:hypothetical protein